MRLAVHAGSGLGGKSQLLHHGGFQINTVSSGEGAANATDSSLKAPEGQEDSSAGLAPLQGWLLHPTSPSRNREQGNRDLPRAVSLFQSYPGPSHI